MIENASVSLGEFLVFAERYWYCGDIVRVLVTGRKASLYRVDFRVSDSE